MKKIILSVLIMLLLTSSCTKNVQNTDINKSGNVVGLSNDEYNNRMTIYPEFFPLFGKAA